MCLNLYDGDAGKAAGTVIYDDIIMKDMIEDNEDSSVLPSGEKNIA